MQLRRLVTPTVVGVALVTFAALAVSAHGNPVQHVSLNDGGIWVTNNATGQVGRFAKPIAELEGLVSPRSPSRNINVWQNGAAVAAYDATGNRMYAMNVDDTTFADPAGAEVSPAQGSDSVALGGDTLGTGGDTLAVLAADHSLRSATLDAGGGLGPLALTAPALARKLPANSAVAVGTDDTIWVAGGGKLWEFTEGATASAPTRLPLPATDSMQVTTVGNVPVVADAATKALYLPETRATVTLPAAGTSAGFELQQPSGASGVVVVATSAALYSVDLATGATRTLTSPGGGQSGTVAAPVQVGGCAEEAWASGQAGRYVQTCGTPPPATAAVQSFPTGDSSPQLVFRVNDGEVVLNDTANGGVFLADQKVTNVTPKWQRGNTANNIIQVQNQGKPQQNEFRANPLTQGVRPGTTTVVHVLDAVDGTSGATYAVTGVGSPDQPGVTVSVAPDAQTVLATVTSLAGDAHFQYTVDDGHGHSETSTVTLVPRTPGENDAPALKARYQPPALSVGSGGTLVVPVTGDWRDGDGDPVFIDSASVSASAGSLAVTSGGALSFAAPRTAADETVTLTYGVTDGRVAKPAMTSLRVSVPGSSDAKPVAPVAEPDAAQAEAGMPVTLQPLANDLPGVDPTNPNATLRLAAPVSSVAGATVSTDLVGGTVTFTAQNAGDYFLTYKDAYGAAPAATGTIRVHVIPAPGKPAPPVATPDVAVLHGQQPALVDVLADCSDPQGWLMGITDATSGTPGVDVTVIDSEWLRISADDPQPGLAATVSYKVSDGKGSATGTVAVTAVAANPSADQITTTFTAVTVRAGDSAVVPVLAGDASSTGLPLSLAGTPPTADPPLAGLIATAQGTGIRVDAPVAVSSEEETAVSYVATDADGTTAAGELDVTIMPAPSTADPDQPPVPPEVDTRAAAGDTAVIQIPVSGVDPDGDSVTVTGVTVPPALGRIVSAGPDSVTYQSYPGSLGTDTFTYQVTDPYGRTGTAQVRVAVLPPGPPQPPAAVDDVINAPPGASLHWDVLANDYIAPGDKVTVEPLGKTNTTVPPGVRLAGSYVYLRVPASPADPPAQVAYGDTDGSTPSLAQVIVHAVPGAQVPPVANDAIAPRPAPGAATVTVDVLKHDDDPVGSPSDLKVSWVPAGVTVNGADLTIGLACYPREVPYQVTAPDKLTASAVVYVPGTNSCAHSATISLKPGAQVSLKENGTVTVPLSSVLTDSAGRQLKIATSLTASPPGELSVSANQQGAFTLQAAGGYTGPGAVTVQVYDGATASDANGTTATVTIPVQVGSDVPVLSCPATPLPVVEGGAAQRYDIGQLCHVSADTAIAQTVPHYTVSWAKAAAGVSESVPGGTSLELSAASGAAPGAAGTLKVTAAGAVTGSTLNVQVVKAPLPAGGAASVSGAAGHSVTVDLRQYVTSPLAQPAISVLGVSQSSGSPAAVSHSGADVTITPGAAAAGLLTFAARVSDEPGRADRAISVQITVTVTGRPGAPGAPAATPTGSTLVVSFAAAAANGSPVQYYTVYANGTGHQCAAAPCTIAGLTAGTTYTVYVTATNSAGTGPDSSQATAVLNAVPGQVTGVSATPGDGSAALTWQAPAGNPTGYEVEVSPAPAGQNAVQQLGSATSGKVTGLTDGTTYTLTVRATSAAGDGAWSLGVTAVPFGKPATMAAPAAVALSAGATGAGSHTSATVTTIEVNVAPSADNGSPVTAYTVYEYKAASSSGPWGGAPVATGPASVTGGGMVARDGESLFDVSNDGSWYEFTATETNAAGESAQSPLSSPPIQASQAATAPSAPTGVTAKATGQNNTIQFSFTAGGQASSIEYGINGATDSGTINGTFTAGTGYTETLTSASDSGIVNGTPVTVYVAACTSATACSSFSGPSAQVIPYGPIATPVVSATANGTTVSFTFSEQGDGLALTVDFCETSNYDAIGDLGCTVYGVANSQTPYSNSFDLTYGYDQAVTFTVTISDSAGQKATATTTTTTAAAPPAGAATVSVAQGTNERTTIDGCTSTTIDCYQLEVTLSNFPANSVAYYSCVDNGFQYQPSSGTTDQAWDGMQVTTDSSGAATFASQCVYGSHPGDLAVVNVTVGSTSASGRYTAAS